MLTDDEPSKMYIGAVCLNLYVMVKSKSFAASIKNRGAYALIKSRIAVNNFGFINFSILFAIIQLILA